MGRQLRSSKRARVALLLAGAAWLTRALPGWSATARGRVALAAAGSAGSEKAEWVTAVKNIQKAGISGKMQWRLFVNSHAEARTSFGKPFLDPGQHDADFLQDFVDNYLDGYRISSPAAAVAECAQLDPSGKFNEAMEAYVTLSGSSGLLEDDKGEMVKFLESLADSYLSHTANQSDATPCDVDPAVLTTAGRADADRDVKQGLDTPSSSAMTSVGIFQVPTTAGTADADRDDSEKPSSSAKTSSVATTASSGANWVWSTSGTPLGEEGLQRILERYSQLKGSLSTEVRAGLAASDAEAVRAVLELAAPAFSPAKNINGFIAKTFRSLRSYWRADDPLGKDGLAELSLRHIDFAKNLNRWTLYTLTLSDTQDAEAAVQAAKHYLSSAGDEMLNADLLVEIFLQTCARLRRSFGSPLGEEAAGEAIEKLPELKSSGGQHLLSLADAKTANDALKLLDQSLHGTGSPPWMLLRDALLISLDKSFLSVERWVKMSEKPLGPDGLLQVLRENPRLQGVLDAGMLEGLALSDAEASKAVLKATATSLRGYRTVRKFVVSMFRTLQSYRLDACLGSEGAAELLAKFAVQIEDEWTRFLLSSSLPEDAEIVVAHAAGLVANEDLSRLLSAWLNRVANLRSRSPAHALGKKAAAGALGNLKGLDAKLKPLCLHMMSLMDASTAHEALMQLSIDQYQEDQSGLPKELYLLMSGGRDWQGKQLLEP